MTIIPTFSANTIIVGAGAAGMNAAVQLVRFWELSGVANAASRVAVVTRGLGLGASRMSGSDKQTYYKMGTSPTTPDTAVDFAATLTANGACNGDTALVEGLGSLRGFYNLVDAGVPFPHDPVGTFIGYKTDHDPAERATSAGPKTSRFMSQCLQRQVDAAGVKIYDGIEPIELVVSADKIVAMLAIDRARLDDANGGLALFVAANWILAAGGAGEIYADSVYPRGQTGMHGIALKAGLTAVNLTESQYGLASTKFRWNVSGTYMQVAPRIFSTNAKGKAPREFLTDYFDSTAEMAGAIFLKGYQWPFDAQRIAGHQSTLVDMAVHMETAAGRRVWMDFLTNPVGAKGWDEFSIDSLPDEAKDYLLHAAATQATPLERLAHMNQPAIDIYTENGIDLSTEPLEIAVCAQHHNGGFAVNKWWESSTAGTFIIGEMAGTHGVKRPGGSALNAGQVGALRAAEYIAHARPADMPDEAAAAKAAAGAIESAKDRLEQLKDAKGATPAEAMDEIRERMTAAAAHLRYRPTVDKALGDAIEQYRRIQSDGLKCESTDEAIEAIQVEHQCLIHAAMLFAIREMLERGAGSRGSHCVLDDAGEEMHPKLINPDTRKPYRVKAENEDLKDHILAVRHDGEAEDLFQASDEKPRPIPELDVAFETAWREFREGNIYGP